MSFLLACHTHTHTHTHTCFHVLWGHSRHSFTF